MRTPTILLIKQVLKMANSSATDKLQDKIKDFEERLKTITVKKPASPSQSRPQLPNLRKLPGRFINKSF